MMNSVVKFLHPKGDRFGAVGIDLFWTIALFGAALLLFTIDLGGVALRDWDEGTVAQVAKEIYQSGTIEGWLFPQLWGTAYLNKPPLIHGLIAIVYAIAGIHDWTTRLPGAVLTACSVPLLYQLGRELFPTTLTALLGSAVYLTLLPVVRHGRLAMLDGAIVCFFLLLLICVLRSRRDQRWCLGIGLGFACMVLTKGILAILLLAIALVFVVLDTPRLLRSPYWWLGLGLGAVPSMGWYLAQGVHWGWAALGVSLGSQGFQRVVTSVENNGGAPWYYALELVKYSWPWLLFLPWGLQQLWHDRSFSAGKLLLVWLGGYLLVISGMGTKLPWYIFPLYPAIALTVGIPLADRWTGTGGWGSYIYSPRSLPRVWIIILGILGTIATGGLVYFSPWGGDPSVMAQVSVGFASSGLLLASYLGYRHNPLFIPVLLWSWYLALLCLLTAPQWLWELEEDYPVKPVAAMISNYVPQDGIVYTNHPNHRPSLDFYSDRPVQPLDEASLMQKLSQPSPHLYFLLTESLHDRLVNPNDPNPSNPSDPSNRWETIATAEHWFLMRMTN